MSEEFFGPMDKQSNSAMVNNDFRVVHDEIILDGLDQEYIDDLENDGVSYSWPAIQSSATSVNGDDIIAETDETTSNFSTEENLNSVLTSIGGLEQDTSDLVVNNEQTAEHDLNGDFGEFSAEKTINELELKDDATKASSVLDNSEV